MLWRPQCVLCCIADTHATAQLLAAIKKEQMILMAQVSLCEKCETADANDVAEMIGDLLDAMETMGPKKAGLIPTMMAADCVRTGMMVVYTCTTMLGHDVKANGVGVGELSEKWKGTLKDIRKKVRGSNALKKANYPLNALNGSLGILDIAVNSLKDPKAAKAAKSNVFKFGEATPRPRPRVDSIRVCLLWPWRELRACPAP